MTVPQFKRKIASPDCCEVITEEEFETADEEWKDDSMEKDGMDEDCMEKDGNDDEDSMEKDGMDEDNMEKDFKDEGNMEKDSMDDEDNMEKDTTDYEDSLEKDFKDEDSVEKDGTDYEDSMENKDNMEKDGNDDEDCMENDCKLQVQEAMNEDDEEHSQQLDVLVEYHLDLSTQSLKEEIEEATQDVQKVREESEGDDKLYDGLNNNDPEEKIERISQDEVNDEIAESASKDVEEGNGRIIIRISADDDDEDDEDDGIIVRISADEEDHKESQAVFSSEQETVAIGYNVELDEETGKDDVDASGDGHEKPVDQLVDNVDDSFEIAQVKKSKDGDALAEIKPDVDIDIEVTKDEMLVTADDGKKVEVVGGETADESSSYSLITEDVEDLVSNEDSREDIDSGLVTDMHTDKSQGTTEETGEDTSCEAADFHDLEGTAVSEESGSFCNAPPTRSLGVDGGLSQLEKGDVDAALPTKDEENVFTDCPNGDASKKQQIKIRTPSIVVEYYGDDETKEVIEIVEAASYVKLCEEEFKDESSDYLTAADVEEAVAE